MEPIPISFGVVEFGNLTVINDAQFRNKDDIIVIFDKSKFDKSIKVNLVQL